MKRGYLKDKLGDYQVDPPEQVWDAVSGQIGHGRKRRGLFILSLATAASIALALTLGIYFFGPDLPGAEELSRELPQELNDGPPAESSRDQESTRNPDNMAALATQEKEVKEEALPEQPENYLSRTPEVTGDAEVIGDVEVTGDAEVIGDDEFTGDAEMTGDAEIVSDAEAAGNFKTGGDTEPDPQPDTTIELNTNPFPELEADKQNKSRWMVGAAISPLYSYRDADAVAMPSNQAESGLLSYSTGVHVRYRRNSRFALETGVYYNRTGIAIGAPGIQVFSQSFDNMIFGIGSESADINTVSNSVGNIVAHSGDIYMNGYKIGAESNSDALQSTVLEEIQYAESGIQQHLDFLELPLNLRYSVIDRSFELQLVGGLSTNFLVGNSVTMEGSSGREEIGYLSNVNTVNYSGNAGLGMIYHFGKKMSLMLEPRFRYFINSVNDATLPSTRPYSLGFYTGLSYTF